MKIQTILSRLLLLCLVLVALTACDEARIPVIVSYAGPLVWLDQPLDGATLSIGAYTLKAHARDTAGGVARINFQVNDTILGSVTTDSSLDLAYAEFGWNPSVPGEYIIVAVATNPSGRESRSAPARVCVGTGCVGSKVAPVVVPPKSSSASSSTSSSVCSGVPVIASFTASSVSIAAGGSVTLNWSVTNADVIEITDLGAVSATGSRSVSPTASTTYTLIALCGSKENFAEKSVTITVASAKVCQGLPVISVFSATPASITIGASSTLRWTVTNADYVELVTIGEMAMNGTRVVSPRSTTTYQLVALCGGKENYASRNVTITVVAPSPTPTRTPTRTPTPQPPPPPQGCNGAPVIASFTASSSSITAGQSVTLNWGAVTNADSVEIDQGIGGVPAPGSTTVTPGSTTTYTMTARCKGTPTTRTVTITVQQQQQDKTPPNISGISWNPKVVSYPPQCQTNTLNVSATITDPSGISGATLYYRYLNSQVSPVSGYMPRSMSPGGGNLFSVNVVFANEPAQFLSGKAGKVEFYLEARDNPGNTGTSGSNTVDMNTCP